MRTFCCDIVFCLRFLCLGGARHAGHGGCGAPKRGTRGEGEMKVDRGDLERGRTVAVECCACCGAL